MGAAHNSMRLRTPAAALLLTVAAACSAVPAATSPAPSASPAPTTSTPSPTVAPTASPSATAQQTPTASPVPATTGPVVTHSPTSSPSPTATPVPPDLAEPIWERVADQASLAGSRMLAVVAGPDRFVAVGATDDVFPVALAWTSTDGRVWSRSPDDLGTGAPTGVIWDGERYVAFGGETEVPHAIWTSPDGLTWQRSAQLPDLDHISTLYIARLGNQLVAIGGTPGDFGEQPGIITFKTWTSADGLAWQPLTGGSAPAMATELAGMISADGKLVAWGSLYKDQAYRAVTLRSNDGVTWERTIVGDADDAIGDVTWNDGQLVAVGHGPYCCEAGATAPVQAWTSADGLAWTPADFQPEPGSDELRWVVRHGGRYVALGISYGMPISWLSLDGQVWTVHESVPDAAEDGDDCTGGPCPYTNVRDLAGGGPGLVAVGHTRIVNNDGDLLGYRSVVWLAPAVED